MTHLSFQRVILPLYDVIFRTIGVARPDGIVIACNETDRIDRKLEEILPAAEKTQVGKQYTFRGFRTELGEHYVAFVAGNDEDAARYAELLSVMLSGISRYRDEAEDNEFVSNVILENLLPDVIGAKAAELGIEWAARYTILLFRVLNGVTEPTLYDAVEELRRGDGPSYPVHINETDVALVLKQNDTPAETVAAALKENLMRQYGLDTAVGVSETVEKLTELPRALRSAQTALEVRCIFHPEKEVVSADSLGLARLIHPLPASVCRSFLREVYHKTRPDGLDPDLMESALVFMKENLNLASASERLHIHRNTLVYRLDKIKSETGLDLRNFDEAFLFYVSTFVEKQWKSDPSLADYTQE